MRHRRELVSRFCCAAFFHSRHTRKKEQGSDGLVRASGLGPQRVKKVGDVVTEGQMVKVKFLGMHNRSKIRLSMKVVDQAIGEDLTAKQEAAAGSANAE